MRSYNNTYILYKTPKTFKGKNVYISEALLRQKNKFSKNFIFSRLTQIATGRCVSTRTATKLACIEPRPTRNWNPTNSRNSDRSCKTPFRSMRILRSTSWIRRRMFMKRKKKKKMVRKLHKQLRKKRLKGRELILLSLTSLRLFNLFFWTLRKFLGKIKPQLLLKNSRFK